MAETINGRKIVMWGPGSILEGNDRLKIDAAACRRALALGEVFPKPVSDMDAIDARLVEITSQSLPPQEESLMCAPTSSWVN